MMFLLDLAFAAELIALAFGVGFLVWACRNNGSGVGLAKFFGYLIRAIVLTQEISWVNTLQKIKCCRAKRSS